MRRLAVGLETRKRQSSSSKQEATTLSTTGNMDFINNTKGLDIVLYSHIGIVSEAFCGYIPSLIGL